MLLFTLTMLIISMISIMFIMLNIFLMKKKKTTFEKNTPIECGFNIINSLTLPFSIQFYYISILFLIFDIELSLILPMIQPLTSVLIDPWSMYSYVISILISGLYFEWYNNLIKWN